MFGYPTHVPCRTLYLQGFPNGPATVEDVRTRNSSKLRRQAARIAAQLAEALAADPKGDDRIKNLRELRKLHPPKERLAA